MRFVLASISALLISTAAFADQADGKVTKIDPEKQTITLDDGKSYKIPANSTWPRCMRAWRSCWHTTR